MAGAFDAGTATGRLVLDLQQWTASVEMAKKDTQSLAGVITSKKEEIEKFGKAFTAVGVAIVGALGLAVKSAVDYTLEIGRMSVKTGIATETLSGLKEAADKSGMSLDELGVGMKRFSSLAFDASTGSQAAVDTLKRLGVSATDASGKLKPMDQLLMETADKFKAMPNGVEKSALAVDLFGRSGTSMIAMLNRGSEGIKEFIAEQKEMGTSITNEGVAKAKAFSYSLMDLEHSFMGVKLAIANAIMPVVKALSDTFGFLIVKTRQLFEIFPPLGNTITIIAGSFGMLAAVVGPLLLMLPQMAKGWAMIVGIIPVLQARLAALGTSLGFVGIAIAAAVVVAQTLTWAIGKYSDACDRAIGDTMRTAGEISKGFKYAREVMKGTDKEAAAAMRSMIDRMREVGFNSEQIGQRIFDMNQKVIGSMKSLVPVTAEMAKAIKTVQEGLTDKLKELTLNEYDYRIYQAKKYYDDLRAEATKAGSDAKTFADIERAQTLEISKIKKEQAEAQAEAHKTMTEKKKKADADYLNGFYKETSAEGKTWNQLYYGMGSVAVDMMKHVASSFGVSFGKIVSQGTPAVEKVKKAFVGARETIMQVVQVLQQGFGQFFTGLQNQSNNYFTKEFKNLDTLFKKQKDALAKDYNAKIAALDAIDAAEALAARKKEIMMSNMTDKEKKAALLAIDTEQAKIAARTKIEADYAAAQAILEAQQAERKLALEIKQAKANKESGIAQALVNTAVAVTTALCSKPFIPMGPIAAAIALAAGLIQIRAIRSTPLPTMADGGVVDRATHAIVGEAGPEAIMPLKELSRMLGLKRGGSGGSKTVNFGNISAIDARGLDVLFSERLLPMIKRAMGNESLTVPVKAVR
jgi:hypothetical protein